MGPSESAGWNTLTLDHSGMTINAEGVCTPSGGVAHQMGPVLQQVGGPRPIRPGIIGTAGRWTAPVAFSSNGDGIYPSY